MEGAYRAFAPVCTLSGGCKAYGCRRSRQRRILPATAQAKPQPAIPSEEFELRVCTHKTCRRQGARQTAQFLHDLALPSIRVTECGCLGNCGSGPNVAALPAGAGREPSLLAHMSTPARVALGLAAFCGVEVDEVVLKATELRLAGNEAARAGELERAVALYSEALELNPSHGRHLLLSNRSGARLASGDAEEALADANEAAACAPAGFTTQYVRQVEALLRLGRHTEAMQVLLLAVERTPSFASSGEYHMMVAHVQSFLKEAAV